MEPQYFRDSVVSAADKLKLKGYVYNSGEQAIKGLIQGEKD